MLIYVWSSAKTVPLRNTETYTAVKILAISATIKIMAAGCLKIVFDTIL